jgi:hypothetical protein
MLWRQEASSEPGEGGRIGQEARHHWSHAGDLTSLYKLNVTILQKEEFLLGRDTDGYYAQPQEQSA